ncbi:GNAT family N-acetyltransferase [Corynebacterium sp. 335C]
MIPAGDGLELRRVAPGDAAFADLVEAAVPPGERAATFRFFTRRPFPLREFVAADPGRRTWALVRTRGSASAGDARDDASRAASGPAIPGAGADARDDGARDVEPIACTSVYDASEGEGRVTLGFTWVVPEWRGRGANQALKAAMFRALADAGVREAWFRADVENTPSLKAMERAGAARMHVEDAPRVYDDRVSQSVFYRRVL